MPSKNKNNFIYDEIGILHMYTNRELALGDIMINCIFYLTDGPTWPIAPWPCMGLPVLPRTIMRGTDLVTTVSLVDSVALIIDPNVVCVEG